MDTKFGANVSNKILLNATKSQDYSSYRFGVIKGKLTVGGGAKITLTQIRVKSSNPRVASSDLRVASSNPRITCSILKINILKTRVGRLKARVRRLKAQVGVIKPRVRY